jgi:hypothetical protein
MPERTVDPYDQPGAGEGQASGPGRGARGRTPPPFVAPEDSVLQVRLIAPSPLAFVSAVDGIPVDFGCAGPRVHPAGEVSANVLIRTSALEQLRERSSLVRIEVLADFSANLAQRRDEVGKGNRFADPRTLPEGLGVLIREERQ